MIASLRHPIPFAESHEFFSLAIESGAPYYEKLKLAANVHVETIKNLIKKLIKQPNKN
jgi:hypothetical protein